MDNKSPFLNGKLALVNSAILPEYITAEEISSIAYGFLYLKKHPIPSSLRMLSIVCVDEKNVEFRDAWWYKIFPKKTRERIIPDFFKTRIITSASMSGSYLSRTAKIKLFLPHIKTRKKFIKSLLHELDHVLWMIENYGEFNDSLPYYFRPHERRARRTARHWHRRADKIAKSTGLK